MPPTEASITPCIFGGSSKIGTCNSSIARRASGRLDLAYVSSADARRNGTSRLNLPGSHDSREGEVDAAAGSDIPVMRRRSPPPRIHASSSRRRSSEMPRVTAFPQIIALSTPSNVSPGGPKAEESGIDSERGSGETTSIRDPSSRVARRDALVAFSRSPRSIKTSWLDSSSCGIGTIFAATICERCDLSAFGSAMSMTTARMVLSRLPIFTRSLAAHCVSFIKVGRTSGDRSHCPSGSFASTAT